MKLLSRHLYAFAHSDRTLDIGCGWGFSLKINPRFWLVDGDHDCITYLESQGARASWADICTALPFEDGFFENAFSHDVCEHLREDEATSMFREARRVLRPGGLFMNIVPNRRGYNAGLQDPRVGHKRFVSVDEVNELASRTGFRLERHWHTPLPKVMSELFVHNKLVTVCRAI